LATAVRQGTYKPDPQKIAQQILEDAEIIAKLQAMLKH
jgi:negative regulator of flagellin synthesis FlgM